MIFSKAKNLLMFSVLFEKQIIDVDEEADEITYVQKSTYTFNKHKSLNVSRSDKVTILNPAYIGTILTVSRNKRGFNP